VSSCEAIQPGIDIAFRHFEVAVLTATTDPPTGLAKRPAQGWTACPTIQQTSEMLVFDYYSAVCEPIKAGARVVVERAEQALATRWLCIDHPAASGPVTVCNWETFQDEPKTWLCVRAADKTEPCRWGPVEYLTSEAILAATPRPQ
jgi:hypothetical protein